MTKSAREVIAKRLLSFQVDRDNHEEATSDILKLIDSAGYAIVPKEPSEGMIAAGRMCPEVTNDEFDMNVNLDHLPEPIYRAMLLTAQKEG